MKPLKVAREQQIAIFGEAGSGKTVLLSSFYGAAQEPAFAARTLYNIVANDASQGRQLHQNYLGMKNAASTPMANRFAGSRYVFTVKRRPTVAGKRGSSTTEDLRLVWHDYPGEWFEEEPATDEEHHRRTETFQALLGSDVAVLLVDAQRLLDQAGEEERYLKALLTTYSTHLSRLRGELTPNGKRLVKFPRVWMFGLSKSDLLPEMDVTGFRDLMVEKVGHEISRLQEELAAFIDEPDAFSLGEDFVLLSSAQFKPGTIDVSKQVGVRLMLPIAAMLPFSRHLRWAKALRNGSKVANELLKSAGPILTLVATRLKLPKPLRFVAAGLPLIANPVMEHSQEKLQSLYDRATDKHDFLAAVLVGFRLDLSQAKEEKVLLESEK
jgi:hypothetical protein